MQQFNCTLLIDDDAVNNFVTKKLLQKFIISNGIQTVQNGQEALEFIVNYDPDLNSCPELIFLDIDMPVMDGFSFLDCYRKLEFLNKNKIVIVMLTNSMNQSDREKCEQYGVNHFLNKPLTEEKVLNLLEKIDGKVPQ